MFGKQITLAPIPKWRDMLCAMAPGRINSHELAKPWLRQGEMAGWFSRSAWSLAQIVMWRQRQKGKGRITVFVPDFFCNASLVPLRDIDVRLFFYPVTSKMQPDYKGIRQQAKINPPDVLLVVHYFGCPVPTAPAKDFCHDYAAWLIEDAAHVLKPIPGIGKFADFILYSPHKLLPIPDGALLIARADGANKLGKELLLTFGDPKKWHKQFTKSLQLFSPHRFSHRQIFEWFVKRLLQKLGARQQILRVDYCEICRESASVAQLPTPAMSGTAQRILKSLLPSLNRIARWRLRNQLLWDELLLKTPGAGFEGINVGPRSTHGEWIPYNAVYNVDERCAGQVFADMQNTGFPVMTWPDLPPEVFANGQLENEAVHLRHSHIHLPLHQSVSVKDIVASFKSSAVRLGESSSPKVELVWDNATRGQWQEWLKQAGQSNMMQSWEYGEAKADVEGWIVRRCVFQVDGTPVAIVQVLEKRYLGLLHLSRVNRGPLFLCKINDALKMAVIKCLTQELAGIRRGRIFSFAPELPLTGHSINMLTHLGLRQNSPYGWESIWLDLREDTQKLRKKLDGKWRNMLSFAERHDLQLDVVRDADSFEWILKQCNSMMQARKGPDVPVAFYRKLWRFLNDTNQPAWVFRALAEDEVVAGICVVPHGSAATYLLGWNGDYGRKLKANQFLLWNAMTFLKQNEFCWFDLGGIDQEKTPGITTFKLGVNGERYSLVGESWKW